METLVVVTHAKDLPLAVPSGVRVVTARSYLLDPEYSRLRRAKVFNLCRNYSYQSLGYYVSLLAEARGHKTIPTVLTMQDLRQPAVIRLASDELDAKINKSLASIHSDKFILSIYFGHNTAKRHDALAMAIFKLFPAPFLRANFTRSNGQWELHNITTLSAGAIPNEHLEFALEAATAFFARKERPEPQPKPPRFDLAILYDPKEFTSPSGDEAIAAFTKAAEEMDFAVEVIGKEDYGRLAEFDGLFIRTTTAVNNYTYKFSRRAAAEGLVVIDDPVSIMRCSNKVYLAELLAHNDIPIPHTLILHKDNIAEIASLGFPCILKQPDSTFSLGVVKVHNEEEFELEAKRLFESSELIIAQEFMPTSFDWRIGIIDRRPLFGAKYFMVADHWQVIHHDRKAGTTDYGESEILPVEDVPIEVTKMALKATNLIGDGFYGVDLKQVGKQVYVIEVNDNPSVDWHCEDRYLGDELYRRIMAVFLRRIEEVKEGRGRG